MASFNYLIRFVLEYADKAQNENQIGSKHSKITLKLFYRKDYLNITVKKLCLVVLLITLKKIYPDI